MNEFMNPLYNHSTFKFTILSNVSKEVIGILRNFVRKYEDKSLNFRGFTDVV